MLFNIVVDVTKEVKGNINKLQIIYRKLEPTYLTEREFADDLIIMPRHQKESQQNFGLTSEKLEDICIQNKINGHRKKTTAITLNGNNVNREIEIFGSHNT